jgi:imidazolonepropionase-like amidohydrolase
MRGSADLEFALRGAAQPAVEVLQSATMVNADLLGRAGNLGTLKPGSAADVLLVSGNPLSDISVLVDHETTMQLVVRAGEVLLDRQRP